MGVTVSPVPEGALLSHECLSSNPVVCFLAEVHPKSEDCSHDENSNNATDQLGIHYSELTLKATHGSLEAAGECWLRV
jgi:hypothetical protein